MKLTSLIKAPKVPVDLEGYIMHSSTTLEVIHLCMQPGQTIPQHPNAHDVVVCLIEGEVTLQTGDKNISLSLYDVAEIEKDTPRGFTNTGKSKARLLIRKKQ